MNILVRARYNCLAVNGKLFTKIGETVQSVGNIVCADV